MLFGLAQDEVRSTGENFGESARSVNTGFTNSFKCSEKGVKQEIDCKKTFLVQFAHYLNLVGGSTSFGGERWLFNVD